MGRAPISPTMEPATTATAAIPACCRLSDHTRALPASSRATAAAASSAAAASATGDGSPLCPLRLKLPPHGGRRRSAAHSGGGGARRLASSVRAASRIATVAPRTMRDPRSECECTPSKVQPHTCRARGVLLLVLVAKLVWVVDRGLPKEPAAAARPGGLLPPPNPPPPQPPPSPQSRR